MSDDRSNLCVVINVRKDALTDLAVRLHQTTFFKGEWPFLLEEARRKSDFSDVVNESGKVTLPLLFLAQSHTPSNVTRVDRYGCRVAGCIPVSRVKSRNQRRRE